jgi:hypothetical protein
VTAWEALLTFWLSLPAAAPYSPPLPAWSGSLVRTDVWHLGIRPSSDDVGDWAATIQLTGRPLSF